MKMLLLPKKSTSALQKQFLNCRQNDASIDASEKPYPNYSLILQFVNLKEMLKNLIY